VAIARALLRDVPLLLLDEPTAHLDGVTEAEVIEAVRRFAHGRTVVVVAHRSPLLALCDQVVSLASPRAAA
jgi:ATP-binding cassette subfamily C protein CydCD